MDGCKVSWAEKRSETQGKYRTNSSAKHFGLKNGTFNVLLAVHRDIYCICVVEMQSLLFLERCNLKSKLARVDQRSI